MGDWIDDPESDDDDLFLSGDWFKPTAMEMTFANVDPKVLGILTGGAVGTPPPPTFAMEVRGVRPAKRRTFWEWLRRRPKHEPQPYHYTIPNARLDTEQTD